MSRFALFGLPLALLLLACMTATEGVRNELPVLVVHPSDAHPTLRPVMGSSAVSEQAPTCADEA